jgi:mRNA-degrading endonuclease toxin of MazEF toxin-antitoxin module
MPVYQYGDIFYAPFPFQEGDETKDRPVLVLVPDLPGNSVLVSLITTKRNRFDTCIEITPADLITGAMDRLPCYARPFRVSTLMNSDFRRRLGQAKPELADKVRDALMRKLQNT